MVEKIIINPKNIRGLGNIVSEKDITDYSGYNSRISASNATINGKPMNTFIMDSRTSEKIVLSYEPFISWADSPESFEVTAKVYRANGALYPGAKLTLKLSDGTTLEGTANSMGNVTFNVPIESEGVYYFTVEYTNTMSTKRINVISKGKVIVGTMDNIDIVSQNYVVSPDVNNKFFSFVSCDVYGESIPVPNAYVEFYEEYQTLLFRIKSDLGDVIQTDDVVTLSCIVSDEDGSRIPGQVVYFYEEYESDEIRLHMNNPIETGDGANLTASIHKPDGSPVLVSGETINFYEEYTVSSVAVKSSEKFIQIDDTPTISAMLKDTDGSIIQQSGVSVNFYEEYTISNVHVEGAENVIQTDDEATLSAIVSDADGSRIPGQTVKFYEDYTPTDMYIYSDNMLIQTGGESTLSARVRDIDGSAIPDATVNFYEEYDYGKVELKAGAKTIEMDDDASLTAVLHDKDGSVICEEGITVNFYEVYDTSTIRVVSTMPKLMKSGSARLNAKVVNSMGGAVSGASVNFYEEYDYGKVKVDTDKVIQVDSEPTIKAIVQDKDGSLIAGESVDFSLPIPNSEEWKMSSISAETVQFGDTTNIHVRVRDRENNVQENVRVRFYIEEGE